MRIYYPSPGCRQGTILAPIAAWRRLPGSSGTWPLDILVCSAARWPPRTTSSRASGRTIRAHEQAAETAPPGHGPADHGDHGDHDRPRRSRQVTAITAGHGRRFRTGSRRTPRTPHWRADTCVVAIQVERAMACAAGHRRRAAELCLSDYGAAVMLKRERKVS